MAKPNLPPALIADFWRQSPNAESVFEVDGWYFQPLYSHYSYVSPESGGSGAPVGDGPITGWMQSRPGDDVGYEYNTAGAWVRDLDLRSGSIWKELAIFAAMAAAVYTLGTSLSATMSAGTVTTGAGTTGASTTGVGVTPSVGVESMGETVFSATGGDPISAFNSSFGGQVFETPLFESTVFQSVNPYGFVPTLETAAIETAAELFPYAAESPPASAFYQPIPEIQIAPNPWQNVGNLFTPTNAGVTAAVTAATAGGGFASTIKEVSSAALAVAQTVQAFRQVGGQVQNPLGTNRTVSAGTGLILTRNANGQIVATRPTPGVATATPDGGLVINNGDGSFDYISSTGQRTRRTYAATQTPTQTPATAGGGGGFLSGMDSSTMAFGLAAVVGVLFLMKK